MFLETLLPERPREALAAASPTDSRVWAGPGLPPSLDVEELPRAHEQHPPLLTGAPPSNRHGSLSSAVSGSWD